MSTSRKGSALHQLINRKQVKLSYCCLSNMGRKMSEHNNKLLGKPPVQMGCKCQNKTTCHMPGKCTNDKLFYRATVTANNSEETYVGLTANQFKDKYGKLKRDFANDESSTTLSTHIWNLKRRNKPYTIKWDIASRAAPFSPVSGICNLCTAEKFEIIFNPAKATLNSRNELFNSCRHRRPKLLINVKKKKSRMKGSWANYGISNAIVCLLEYFVIVYVSSKLFTDEWGTFPHETASMN